MEIKHAIAGLVIGLGIIIGFALYKDFVESGKSMPLIEHDSKK